MELEFTDLKLQELFLDMDNVKGSKNLLIRKIGKEFAVLVKKRTNQLKASSTFSNYLKIGLGKPHSLSGENMPNYYGISLTANYRLIVEPKVPDLSAETLEKCDTVIIIGVIDYHGTNKNWLIP